MTKFHTSQDGISRQCNAQTPETCTATPSDQKEHYDTKEEAQMAYEYKQFEKGNAAGSIKKSPEQRFKKVFITEESLLEENKDYVDQLKSLESVRRKSAEDKSLVFNNMKQQTKLAMKILDNAWDLKELTGTDKSQRRYKSYLKSTAKVAKKEVSAINKEIERMRTISETQGYLDKNQIKHVESLARRRVSARSVFNDLSSEIKGKEIL